MFDNHWSRRKLLIFAGTTAWSALAGLAQGTSMPPWDGTEGGAYARTVLASAPLAYWRLDETRGPIARDASGRGNDARYIGRPTFGQPGAIVSEPDRSVGLNGPRTMSYLEANNRDDFSIASSGKGLTVEVWMRPDVLDFKGEGANHFVHWLGKGDTGRYEWSFRFYARRSERPNRISAYLWNPDGKLGAGAYVEGRLTVGAWIYLVATFDDPRKPNAQVRLYKNGQPSPHNHSPGTLYKNYHITPQHGPAPVRLGTRDVRSFLTGGLDEVAIYPRVLGADEILLHWRAGQWQ
jgi:hypothetical protein